MTCLNYKCKKTFTDGIKYFHHASICKPLYFCASCETEYKTNTDYATHLCQMLDETDKNEEVYCIGIDFYLSLTTVA